MVPVSLLDAVAATQQKPFQLLPLAVSNTWELHGINRISVGIDMFSHLFLFFLSLAACSIRSFSSVCHFSSASCITSQTTDQYSCICTAPLTQELEMHAETPNWGLTWLWWCGYNSLPALLQAELTNEGYYILSKCFVLFPIWSNCLLLNELDEKYANGDLDPSFTEFSEAISAESLANS